MLIKILKKINHTISGTSNTSKHLFKEATVNNTKVYGDVTVAPHTTINNSSLCGKVNINKNVKIDASLLDGEVNIGENCLINTSTVNGYLAMGKNCKLNRCEIFGHVTLGRNTSLWGPNLDIYTNENTVEIGSYCSIARNVSFQTYNHNAKKITSYFIGENLFNEKWETEQVSKGKIVVGNDVWIGTHCVILGGVTIGNGAVVAANSVVSSNVPAYAIVGGSPAKVIGYRFEQNLIEQLEKIQWWNWDDEILFKNKELFKTDLSLELLQKIVNEQ